MVSDQEIARCVESLLRHHHSAASSSPSVTGTVTVNGVVRQLEARLGLDLSHKAAFIRDQIDLLLGPPKDHFALGPRPQFHPHHPIPPPPVTTAVAGGGIFAGLPHHADLSFSYPPPPIPASIAALTIGQQQQQQQQQQQLHHHHHQQQFSLQQPPPPASPRPPAPAQKESTPVGVKRRGGPGGLSKVCGVSPELQTIVGEPTMARTQIVKQLWAYIRKNNLQDPNNKRKIICNDELRLVFETDCTDMFKMNKLLAKHITPLNPTKDSGPAAKKLKTTTTEVDSANDLDADQYPVVISDALANFFETGEREMLQSEALRHVWDYIKNNRLEDPMKTMTILCDSKLQQLFGCESLSALEISEMLSHHLFKQS